jgi:hypothetical protein
VLGAATWLAAVVTGLSFLARYDNGAGAPADAPLRWPGRSQVELDPARPTIVMLAHPRCSCSRASVAELAEVVARAHTQPAVYVVFIKPGAVPEGWERTDLWRAAQSIPGVTVLRDDLGIEARRFGAETSGQTLLYAPDGRLLFSGGTTGARGHTGNNHGRASLLAWLSDSPNGRDTTPVFGCSLFGDYDELDHDASR